MEAASCSQGDEKTMNMAEVKPEEGTTDADTHLSSKLECEVEGKITEEGPSSLKVEDSLNSEIGNESDKIENASSEDVNVKSLENKDTSKYSQKALEFLEATEEREQTVEESELDVKKLSGDVLNILNEGRTDAELEREQLIEKSEDLQSFISKLVEILAEKTELNIKLDRQNAALINQAKTLKNVVSITKDLLGLRNMEVEHLHADLKVMEESISAERKRHDLLLQKLSEAMNLNEQLKNEYHTQSGLFQSLREKYHEKILLLTKENQRMHDLLTGNKPEESSVPDSGEADCSTDIIDKSVPDSVEAECSTDVIEK